MGYRNLGCWNFDCLNLAALCLLWAWIGATEGTFEGRIVSAPEGAPVLQGWIYVQSGRRALRRVEVSQAAIAQLEGGHERPCRRPECLVVGQEVRVTAEQDSSGEWRAKRVEILKGPDPKGSEPKTGDAGPQEPEPRPPEVQEPMDFTKSLPILET